MKNKTKSRIVVAFVIFIAVTAIGSGVFTLWLHQQQNIQLNSQVQTAPSTIPIHTITPNPTTPLETTVPKHEHSFKDEIVAPTCTEAGYTVHTCASCGQKVTDSDSGPLGHNWTNWEVVENATIEKEGIKIRTCHTCKETESATIPKVEKPAHEHAYTTIVVEATCEDGGYTRYSCACGAYYDTDYTPMRSHLYGDWETTKWPTQDSTGTEEARCTRCGNVITKTIPKLSNADSDTYANYIDSNIKIERLPDGATSYYRYPVDVIDTRTWGDPPTIRNLEDGGFFVVYYKQDGTKVEWTLPAIAGYVTRMVIWDDGSFETGVIGDFDD